MFRYFLLLFIFSASLHAEGYDPISIYLSWQDNPETTMTVRWITTNDRHDDAIEYKIQGETEWKVAEGSHLPMPDKHPYLIHHVKLQTLNPNTVYAFRIGNEGKVFHFRTMPTTLSAPLRFVAGGDMYHDTIAPLEETQREAAATNPSFALLGGDIAYSAPKLPIFHEDAERWIHWLQAWKETMVTPDGCLIPMLITIGNHDVIGRYGKSPSSAAFFYSLFVAPEEKSYFAIDFDHYMSIFVLDSGHTNSISGEQRDWLYNALSARSSIPHKFALYHVPAYPAVRSPKGPISSEIRNQWVPLFDLFGLTAAFENHDHIYKRSYPMRNNTIDEKKGVLYLGDGAWGVETPRKEKSNHRHNYLAKVVSARHFILVTILPDNTIRYQAIESNGTIIDNYTR